jgi:hypothetical protein
MKCIIFDIDGTLADLSHRLHFISNGKRDYDGFYGALSADTPYEPIKWLYRALDDGDRLRGEYAPRESFVIIGCSGRPDNYRQPTEAWLNRNGICFHQLYMRAAGDFRPDDLIKSELLDQIIADGYEPILAIDDRQRVVDMWRSRGIICLQCRSWTADQDAGEARPPGLLTIMVGPVAGGKSSWVARALASKEITPSSVISADTLRQEFHGNAQDQSDTPHIFRTAHALISARIQNGLPAVLDATNLRRKNRLAAAALAKGGPVRYVICDRPLNCKLATAEWRDINMPTRNGTPWADLVRRFDQAFHSALPDILKGDDLTSVSVLDTRK